VNVLFVAAFFFLFLTFILITSAYWVSIQVGGLETGHTLKTVSRRTGGQMTRAY
jgi:hypothetical protein